MAARRHPWWGLLAVALLGAAFPLTRVAQPLDHRAWDLGFAVLVRLRTAPATQNLAIVGLDEATMAATPAPLALFHPQFGALLEALAAGGARAVALDIVLPDRSAEAIAPGHDLALLRGIVAMRRAGVLVLARTIDDAGHERPIYKPLLAAAGIDGSGFALLPVDPDGMVRRVDERLGADGSAVPTLVGELARRTGLQATSGLINFALPLGIVPLSMQTVLDLAKSGDADLLRRTFGGKVVFIGALMPFVDRHRVPVSISAGRYPAESTPGVYLQAQAFQSFAAGGALRESPAWASLFAAVLCALAWRLPTRGWFMPLVLASGLIALGALSPVMLAMGQAVPVASAALAFLACVAFRFGQSYRADVLARLRLRRVFAGYVSPDVMAELEGGRLEGMTSRRMSICVMFVDVRNFTTRAENDPPERVTAVLNQLFEVATQIVHQHGGTVKEFMGDGVMAFFGAPRALPNPAQAAMHAARAMLASVPRINEALALRGEAPLAIGIGLASGDAVVGHIGSTARHSYGAVGDCVNLASRLEGLTKTLGYPLLISEAVERLIEDRGCMVDLGEYEIKGHRPARLFGFNGRER
ncbi:adenylate/guanylate cyclase domain-containing protein [Variovorax sp. J22R133]|uniref:adenylate/guanylate cyclase domain-containing protein n=1 Tax=Variovorax brevis TaxID=3053503 RepID=UPI0025791C14|nr:adenylate/guanylate cyclase domain-containing protein [Variovorax sp. J22R133]MDM0113905.1 adenylate/guanylate cyclase domain-containing protein [Variovorax sp. J22R133]